MPHRPPAPRDLCLHAPSPTVATLDGNETSPVPGLWALLAIGSARISLS